MMLQTGKYVFIFYDTITASAGDHNDNWNYRKMIVYWNQALGNYFKNARILPLSYKKSA